AGVRGWVVRPFPCFCTCPGRVVSGSPRGGQGPGVNPRADHTKPTEGAGDAAPGGRSNRICLQVVIAAPSVGLPLFSPAALAPGTRHGAGPSHHGAATDSPLARATASGPSRHPAGRKRL